MSSGGGASTASTQPKKVLALQVSQSTYGVAIPRVWGKARVSGNLLGYYDFVGRQVEDATSSGGGKGGGGSAPKSYTWHYSAAIMIAVASGPITAVSRVWVDKATQTLSELGFTLKAGALGQSPWSYLSTHHPAKAYSYSGIAYVAAESFDLGDDPSSPQLNFEVIGERATRPDQDAPPADILTDIWTDPVEGLGLASGSMDLADYRAWCEANDFGLGLAADTQRAARDWLQMVLDATLAEAVPSQGKIRIVPVGDEPVGSWEPDTSYAYHVTQDDVLEEPIFERDQPRTCKNKATVEYNDREKDFNTVTISETDIVHVNLYGENGETYSLPCITRADMAGLVAAFKKDRALYTLGSVELRLSEAFCLLEPADLLLVSFPALGLRAFPLRVREITYSDEGELTVSCKEWPAGVGSPVVSDAQPTGGYVPNYNQAPGNANPPVILEPPVSLAGQPELWLATSGGQHWGGCEVWVSLDDATYSLAGTLTRAARHGLLTANYPLASDPDNANTLAVDISVSGGQLTPASAEARDLYQTLCWVGNAAGGELIAYQGATLTGVGRYSLTNCRRGAYGSQRSAHAVGQQFVRLDGAQFRYAYEPALIGKTLYIKLRSFNKFNAAMQDLADVSALAYVVKGAPLGAVAGLVLESPFNGLTFAAKWDAYPGASYYTLELWSGGTLRKSLNTKDTRFEATIQQLVSWGVARTVELRVVAVADSGQSTEPAVLIATKAQIAAPTVSVQDTSESMIVTASQSSDAAYKATRIAISQTSGFDPGLVAPYYDGPQTAYPSGKLAAGTWYVRVAQYDQFGPDGLNWSSQIALAVTSAAKGVQRVPDAASITAAPGSPPPGGDAYWAAFDEATGRMAMWDQLAGRYIFAPTEAEVAADLAAVNDAIGGQIIQLDAAVVAEAQARTAAIAAEQQARAQALLDEAAARQAAITLTQQLQQSADESLAQEIAQLSAGTGTQFDSAKIWYFKTDLESWTGNGGAPTLVDGWLRAPNHATDPNVVSPAGLAVESAEYRFLKLRIKRVGTPPGAVTLYWSGAGQGFATDRSVAVALPEFDAAGVGNLEVADIPWTGVPTIDRIRIDLGTAQTATDYFLIDWIAIGRPTPAASVAALEVERQARMTGDVAEATSREALASQVRGNYTGTDITKVTSGLVFSERQARTTADSALATRASALEATVNNGTTGVAAAHARITAEESARATGDSANATAISQLTSRVGAAESAITSEETARATADAANAAATSSLQAAVGGIAGSNLLPDEYSTFPVLPALSAAARIADASVAAGAPLGGNSLSFALTTAGSDGYVLLSPGTSAANRPNVFAPAGKYVCSAYVKGSRAGMTARMQFQNANGTSYPATNVTLSTGFVRYSWVVDCSASPLDAFVVWLVATTSNAGDVVTWANVMVEPQRGAITTPSPYVRGVRAIPLAGDNLLPNAGLEDWVTSGGGYPAKWGVGIGGTGSGTVTTREQTTTTLGGRGVKVSTTALGVNRYIDLSIPTSSRAVASPGDVLTSSFYVRASAGAGRVQLLFQWRDTANAAIRTDAIIYFPVLSETDFTRLQFSAPPAPAGTVGVTVIYRVFATDTSPAWWIEYACPQLERGTVASGWKPGLASLASDVRGVANVVTQLQADVSEIDGELTAQAIRTGNLEAAVNHGSTGVAAAHARITAEESARVTADAANASSINQVSARLNSGGDINQAIVQVLAQASATDNKLLGVWGVTVDVNGKLTGIRLASDGRTSSLKIAADEVLTDGSVKAKSLAAAAVTTDKLAAKAVTADKISVTLLSAISAYLGTITSAVIEMVSGTGWQYIRTASKWISDSVNGWISAARPETGDFFQEFRAASGNSLIIERKAGGPNFGGAQYLLYVRDSAGVERLVVDPQTGTFKLRGHIEALSGSFAGELQAATGTFAGSLSAPSGTLGTITAGLMRNPTDTTRMNLNETGAGEVFRLNGKTRIWGNGRVQWASHMISSSWVTSGFDFATTGQDYAPDGGSVDWYWRSVQGIFAVDTGIRMDSILGNAYEDNIYCTVSGWNMDGRTAAWLAARGYKLAASAVPAQPLPINGEGWGGATLRVIVTVRVMGANLGAQIVGDPPSFVINSVVLNIWR